MDRRMLLSLAVFATLLACGPAAAAPWIDPGDSGLRHDIQVLADEGVLRGPVATWPLAWEDLKPGLDDAPADLSAHARAALTRVVQRMEQETGRDRPLLRSHAAVADNPRRIRAFEDEPRESMELGAGLEVNRLGIAARAQVQWVDDPNDDKEWRADGSYLAFDVGNWTLAGSIEDRHWGPGWQSSMILSSNARPVPAITLSRLQTRAFENRWLRWIGPWDFVMLYGVLEGERVVSDAQVFSVRLNLRPLESLEVGITGLGLWCGDDQECGWDNFGELVSGSGDSDQYDRLTGFDLRWSTGLAGVPFALYTHWVGEDFGDGAARSFLPSKLLAQFGVETWGQARRLGTYRLFLEWADTECNFSLYESISDSQGKPGCAYRNSTYQSGQTYRGRSFAHSFDQDSGVATLGGVLNDRRDRSWTATAAYGTLNRRGANRSTAALNETDYASVELSHRRDFFAGRLHAGLGYEYRDDQVTGDDEDDVRAFARWEFAY